MLDEETLIEARRVSGERTYSATVQRALEELIRRARARQVLELAGSGAWQADLAALRDDKPTARRRRGAR